MRLRRARHFRRTGVAGGLVVGAVIAAASLGAGPALARPNAPGQAAEGFNRGTGSAVAESIRLDPVAGGLSFGIGIGQALAGHQNSAAIAESRAANLGVIGTTLAAEACDGGDPSLPAEDQPGVLRVESNEEGASDGKADQDEKVPGVDRQVRATTAPFAEAITTGANLQVPDAVTVQGTRAAASSGVDGEMREAIARSEVGVLSIAGVVELRGMVWEAVHRTGSTDEQVGTFTLGSLSIGGTPVPFEDPTQALAQANEALRPLGFEIRPPRVHIDETAKGTITTVDPLGIRVIPSETRDGVLGPVISGAQPARQELFAALIELDCSNASFITVVDVLLNAFGAGGYFAIELGGVQASTAELVTFQGLGAAGGSLPSLAGTAPASGTLTGGSSATSSTGGGSISASTGGGTTGAAPAAPAAGGAAGGGETAIDTAPTAADVTGTRGGTLAAVAGAGLLLLLATAEGDRRKMRRAMREIPMEA